MSRWISGILLFLAMTVGMQRRAYVVSPTEYVGSEACVACHPTVYRDFMKTGHAHLVNATQGDQPPHYPFSSVPSPPEGYGWSDISYVIGGYGWKARFLDRRGYLITGEAAQYNLATKAWAPFHPECPSGSMIYDCAECHTTGWLSCEENGGAHQEALEGISGTWVFPGVQCERCHGEGGEHVARGGDPQAIVADPSSQLCGQCHYLNGKPRVDAQGGLMLSDQYDQLLNSPHRMLTCVVCHDPHKSTRYGLGGVKKDPGCRGCHRVQRVDIPQMADLACEQCHMPLVATSAVRRTVGGRVRGDMHSHTFKLHTDLEAQMFSEDGRFMVLDGLGNAVVRVEMACQECHNGERAWAQCVGWMVEHARQIHQGMHEGSDKR